MAYTRITEIKSVDDAREIIDYSFLYGNQKIIEALNYLNDHNETWPAKVMTDPDNIADVDGTRRKAAKEYETWRISTGQSVDSEVKQQAADFVRDFDARNNSIVNSFEEENVVDGNPISAYDSYNELLARLEAYEDDKNINGTWRDIVKDIDKNIIFGSEKNPNLVLQDTLWETVKTNILRNRTLSKDWQDAMRNGTAHDFLKEEIYSAYMAEAEIQAKALEVPEPQGKEKEIGSQEHADFLAGVYNKAKEIFADLGQKGKKLKITETSVVVGAAEAYAKFNEFTEYLKAKRDALGKRIYGNKLVQAAEGYANRFDKKMEKDHPKLWGKFKTMALGIRASKYQIRDYAIGGAIVGAAGLVGAGAGTVALGLFSAYTAVGAWVYPIVQRKQMELIKARKEDPENARKWEGKAGFMRAFDAIWYKKDENGKLKTNWREGGLYLVKGVIGSAASLAVMDMATNWLGNGKALSDAVTNNSVGHWLQGLVKAPETVKAQALATFNRSIVRSVGAILPSVATVAGDTTDLAFNIVTWNKKGIKRAWDNLKGSLLGLGIVGAISGVSLGAQAAMINHQYAPDADNDSSAQQKAVEQNLTGNKSKTTEGTPTDGTDLASTSWKSKGGLTTVEENGKLITKDSNGNIVATQETKDIKGWDGATEKQKAAYVQNSMASVQADIDDQKVLNSFKAFLPTDENGNAYIPTTAAEANMTAHEWQVFNQRLLGIISTEDGASHVGVAQLDLDAVREESLKNLMKYMSGHPDAFPKDANPLDVLNKGLESHYYSVGHGYFDGDGHWIAEKYRWIEMDGKEVEVMGRFAKVGDGDTYGRITGDYLRLNGQKLKIEDGFVTIKGEKVAVETGYAKVGDQMVQFNPASQAKITVGGTEYDVGSKWLYGDSSNEAQMNAFMNIICGKNNGDAAGMGASISKLTEAAAQAYATGEGNNAVGIGRNCDEVTVFKFAKKHAPVVHHEPVVEPKEEASGRSVVTDTVTKKESSGRTVVTDVAVDKPQEDQGSSYLVVRRQGVNKGTTDNLPGSKALKNHDNIKGVTFIKQQKSAPYDK